MMALADAVLRMAGFRAPKGGIAVQGPPSTTAVIRSPARPSWPAVSGQMLVRKGWERNSTVGRCVEIIADTVAGLDFQSGNARSRNARPTAPMAKLLGPEPGSPNTQFGSKVFWKWILVQYLVLGKFAWAHSFDENGNINGLWPLLAQQLRPVRRDQAKPGEKYFDSFEYGFRGRADFRTYRVDEITYAWRPSQSDFLEPESPLQSVLRELEILGLLSDYDRGFLQNGGVPAHIVVTPPWASDGDRQIFRRQFNDKFRGPANVNKTAFAEVGTEFGDEPGGELRPTVDVKTIGTSQKDSQLRELEKDKTVAICAKLGVPMSFLDSRLSKFTNMDVDDRHFWRKTIRPRLGELESIINRHVAPKFGGNDIGWFDVAGVRELRNEPGYTVDEGLAMLAAKVITLEEFRNAFGWGPAPEELQQNEPAPQPEPAAGDPAEKPPAPAPAAPAPVVDPAPRAQAPRTIRATATRDPLLEVLRGQLVVFMADQRRTVERALNGRRGRRTQRLAEGNLNAAYDLQHWQARGTELLAPALRGLGLGSEDVTHYIEDVTGEVFDALSLAFGLDDDIFDPDTAMGLVDAYLGGIPVDVLKESLMQLDSGAITQEAALAMLEAS